MDNPDFGKIVDTFVTYFDILENPSMTKNMELKDLKEAFGCCQFIETLIARVHQEEKQVIFEENLNYGLSQKGKSITYKYSNFEMACDKMLEIYMKDTRVPTEKVDWLLNLYIQSHGQERLTKFLDGILRNSMCCNSILNSMMELKIPISELHDEAVFATWEKEVCNGKLIEVSKCVDKMLDNRHILKLINFVLKNDINPETKNLIMKRFTSRAFQNNPQFLKDFNGVDAKSLRKLLMTDSEFCLNFLDTVFYFGRSMMRKEGEWVSEEGVEYKDIAKIFRILLEESNDVSNQTKERLDLAREMDGEFWDDIRRDCLRYYRLKKEELRH